MNYTSLKRGAYSSSKTLMLIKLTKRLIQAYVPAAAVKPAPRVVGSITGPKASVAGFVSSWSNPAA